jgi:leucyl-tRNA synthetase
VRAGADATASEAARAARREVHLVLKQVSHDFERLQYNTVISGAMKLLNTLEDATRDGQADPALVHEGLSVLLRMLYPACPHITHALWTELGYAAKLGDLLDAPWPAVDEAALVQDEIELMLQVNGKLRGSIKVPAAADKAAIEAVALASPDFVKFAEGKLPKKVVIVPGRLVNVVV